ncbi:hypothetical protein FKG94_23795 [Exilibacterium tricleocarpae]|uniref:Uncharacterized protein n=1 Tax=Exilibacterium tricleocarpae TaxID=2591008 RepID=A0A545ST36_9GAMM|nr:hypothetical protein [Exilibacterium tricleocarpae]TQV68117.1 hypothetical protein FKG94_23795 [Exilibacterium tricleocarpae]
MKKNLLTITLVATLFQLPAYAGAPTCHTSSGVPYCNYTGAVKKLYINSSGLILVYFDTLMDQDQPINVGIQGLSRYNAAAYQISENTDYANYLYSTLLTAQSMAKPVTFQMWGTQSGYMKVTKIWLNQ